MDVIWCCHPSLSGPRKTSESVSHHIRTCNVTAGHTGISQLQLCQKIQRQRQRRIWYDTIIVMPQNMSAHYYYYCYCYYYYSIWMSLLTGLFFLVLLLTQRWSPPLRLQASHCSTFRIMCDIPSIAVFCSESIEYLPGTASKFFPEASLYYSSGSNCTGTIVHFRFQIRCSIPKFLYYNFFSASFCTTFLSAGIVTPNSAHVFSFLFLMIISGLLAVTSLSVCTAWFHNNVTSPYYYYYYPQRKPVYFECVVVADGI